MIAALNESIEQATANLSPNHADVVSDIGAVSLTHIQRDVPVARVRDGDPNGKPLVGAAVVGESLPRLEAPKVGVVGQHHVALGVGLNNDNVAAVHVLSGVDEFHGGVIGESENSLTNDKLTHEAGGENL